MEVIITSETMEKTDLLAEIAEEHREILENMTKMMQISVFEMCGIQITNKYRQNRESFALNCLKSWNYLYSMTLHGDELSTEHNEKHFKTR